MKLRICIYTIAFAMLILSMSISAGFAEIPKVKKVVIIGFDGADYQMTDRWIKEGKLPNLAKLKQQGTYLPLMPTNPPQTPVSWASFATSINPGRTRIFDFLKREKGSYFPTFAMMTEGTKPFLFGEKNPLYIGLISAGAIILILLILLIFVKRRIRLTIVFLVIAGGIFAAGYEFASKYLPVKMPDAINNRQGKTFWKVASENGIKTEIFRVPTTFPAEELDDGEMLSGLGVPDMRGTIGQPSIYTDDSSLTAKENEFSIKFMLIDPEEENPIKTQILGPRNKIFYDPDKKEEMEAKNIPERINTPLELAVDWNNNQVTVNTNNQKATLKIKEWSDWIVLDFKFNPIINMKGMVRFYLYSLHPRFVLYMSPLHFHPSNHQLNFSSPSDWADKLSKQFGLFKTMGWATDTWTITSNVVEEDHFIDDMYFTTDQYEKMMKGLLKKNDYQLYIQVYFLTDFGQHILWRLTDPQHPMYDKQKADKYGNVIFDIYARMDKIVGEVMSMLPPDTLLIICSDHGFTSFRRGINYNTWLVKNGFMTLQGQNEEKTLDDLFGQGDFFTNVDWSKTKAYAIGLGPIYINLKGREPQGSVQPGAEYEQVRNDIIKGLEEYVDPQTGQHPVFKVYKRENIYHSFDTELIPDLRAANAENYRVSWQTTLGGVPPDIMEDNMKVWSADHCSIEPSLIRGIFFSNYKITRDNPHIMDIYPSVLQALGVTAPSDIDGKSFY